LFCVLVVVAIAFASMHEKVQPALAAGMLCIGLLFSAVMALPRTMLIEDEQGTIDLLRLIADPQAALFGKLLFNVALMLGTGLALTVLYVELSGVTVALPGLLVGAVVCESIALAGGVSLCGAVASGASNRWTLAAALAVPLLLPQVAMGVQAISVAFSGNALASGYQCLFGLAGFGVASLALAPLLGSLVWRLD
jgi:heme exporter protein B